MTDVAAAVGLAQLRKAERMRTRRREIAGRYSRATAGWAALQPPHDRLDCEHVWHIFLLRLNPGRLRIDRAAFITSLKELQHRRQRAFHSATPAPLLSQALWLSAGGFSGGLRRIRTRDLAAHLRHGEGRRRAGRHRGGDRRRVGQRCLRSCRRARA